MWLVSTSKHWLQEMQHHGAMCVQRDQHPAKNSVKFKLYQLAHGLVQLSFENLQKQGFHSLFETLFQYFTVVAE